MKSFREHAVAAAFAFAAVAAVGSAPAFAWGAGAPDSAYSVYYDHPAQAKQRAHAYYDYAAPSQHRHPVVTRHQGSADNAGGNQDSVPPIGGWW